MLNNNNLEITMKHEHTRRGFTLVELMVTLALAAILVMWAAPNFEISKKNYQLDSALNRLNISIGWARSEAIRTQMFVVVEPLSGSWANGWRVFTDKNRNRVYEASTDEILKTEESFPATVTATEAHSIQINPSGMITEVVTVGKLSNGIRVRDVSVRMNRLFVCDPETSGLPLTASVPSCF
jgi:prepilin-type N-terminal cleavage/methylation domain-containing protein